MATHEEIHRIIIEPMVAIWGYPPAHGDDPKKARSIVLQTYISDLSRFSSGELKQTFETVRHGWKYASCPKSSNFFQAAKEINGQSAPEHARASLNARAVEGYLSADFTKRKHQMWDDWLKSHWRGISYTGQQKLKDYFFKKYREYFDKNGSEPPTVLHIITEGVVAHFQTEYGSFRDMSLDPDLREKVRGMLWAAGEERVAE